MTDIAVFTSAAHPEGQPWALVYAGALIKPLGACMLPVMIVTLVAVLEQQPVLPYLMWGFPGALALASLWTRFRLSRTPAEVHVRAGQAAVRSVHECLQTDPPLIWQRILEIRDGSSALFVTLGLDTYTFRHDEWPQHPELMKALKRARHANPWASASHTVQSRL